MAAVAAALLLGTSACGEADDDGARGAVGGTGGGAGGSEVTAADVAGALEALPAVTGLSPLRRSDVTSLPGAPTDFVEGWVVRDRRQRCAQPGIECGALVEAWGSAESAARRSDEVRTLQLGTVGLGTETHLLAGPVLVRLDGAVTRRQVAAYRTALEDAGVAVTDPEPLG